MSNRPHIYTGPDLYEELAYWATVIEKTEQGIRVSVHTPPPQRTCDDQICEAYIPLCDLRGSTQEEKSATLAAAKEDDEILVVFMGWSGDRNTPYWGEPLFSQQRYWADPILSGNK